MFLVKYRNQILSMASVVLLVGSGIGIMYFVNGIDQENAKPVDLIEALVMLGFGIYFFRMRLKDLNK